MVGIKRKCLVQTHYLCLFDTFASLFSFKEHFALGTVRILEQKACWSYLGCQFLIFF